MGSRDFDNLFKVLYVKNVLSTNNIISQEADFELPRGFIAKIFKMIFILKDFHEDLDGLGTALDLNVTMGLLRDPDDVTTVEMANNSVQHDSVGQHTWSYQADVDAGSDLQAAVMSETLKIIDIPEHIDLITARNMRFNSVGSGSDVASLTESQAAVEIHYTLEKVTDADILELLDIL